MVWALLDKKVVLVIHLAGRAITKTTTWCGFEFVDVEGTTVEYLYVCGIITIAL